MSLGYALAVLSSAVLCMALLGSGLEASAPGICAASNGQLSDWECDEVSKLLEDEGSSLSLVQMKARKQLIDVRQPRPKQSSEASKLAAQAPKAVVKENAAMQVVQERESSTGISDAFAFQWADLTTAAAKQPAMAEAVIAACVLTTVVGMYSFMRKDRRSQPSVSEEEDSQPAGAALLATLQPDPSNHRLCIGPRRAKTTKSDVIGATPFLSFLCPEIDMTPAGSWYAVSLNSLYEGCCDTGDHNFALFGPSGEDLLYGSLGCSEDGQQSLKLAMTADAKYPVATVIAQVSADMSSSKHFQIVGPGDQPFGRLQTSGDELVLQRNNGQVASISADASNRRLMLYCCGNRAPAGSARIRTQSNVLSGEEYVEIRASPGNDGILALCCMLAAIIFWDAKPSWCKRSTCNEDAP